MSCEAHNQTSASIENIKRAVCELEAFMKTDEWLMILGTLGAKDQKICLHIFDDVCGMYDAIYLTGNGFIDHSLKPINSSILIVEGFIAGYFYGASEHQTPMREPMQLIPWIREKINLIKGEKR